MCIHVYILWALVNNYYTTLGISCVVLYTIWLHHIVIGVHSECMFFLLYTERFMHVLQVLSM